MLNLFLKPLHVDLNITIYVSDQFFRGRPVSLQHVYLSGSGTELLGIVAYPGQEEGKCKILSYMNPFRGTFLSNAKASSHSV